MDYVSNFSVLKLEKVRSIYNPSEYLGVYFPLFRNHNNWYEFDFLSLSRRSTFDMDENFYHSGFLGSQMIIGSKDKEKYRDFKNKSIYIDSSSSVIDLRAKEDIRNFVSIAKKAGSEVLIVTSPDPRLRYWNYYFFDELNRFCDSLEVAFLDLNEYYDEMDLKITDFKDNSHLNTIGSIKASKFLAGYLKRNYTFKDRSSEDIFKEQTEGYNAFLANNKSFEKLDYHQKVDQILFDELAIKNLVITKEQKDKLSFYIKFEGNLTEPFSLEDYQLAIHIFPDKRDINSLNEISKSRKRNYEVHGYLFENDTTTINLEFDSNISHIEKLEFFLYDKDGFVEVIGEKVIVDNFESNKARYNAFDEIAYHQPVNEYILNELKIEDVSIVKDQWDKLSFTINFEGDLQEPLLLEDYRLAVHIFPQKSDINSLNEISKSRKRDYEVHGYLFEKDTRSINVEFDSDISVIQKLEFFLYDKDGFAGVVGDRIVIDSIQKKLD